MGNNRETKVRPPILLVLQLWFYLRRRGESPSSELVKGPFRVSSLIRMMEAGDRPHLTWYPAAHVEEYDNESESNAVREAQIELGNWSRLGGFSLYAGNCVLIVISSGIYSPSDACLRTRAEGAGVLLLVQTLIRVGFLTFLSPPRSGNPINFKSRLVLCFKRQRFSSR
jgi:hypothetical protein